MADGVVERRAAKMLQVLQSNVWLTLKVGERASELAKLQV